ncbi:MAG: glutamine synthetase III [Desulfobacteraceae bacterium]|nr:glutamine synthetase III [Desulfobacteraceae bacterium]
MRTRLSEIDISTIKGDGIMTTESGRKSIPDYYGENVFGLKVMRNYLSEKAYKSLSEAIKNNAALDPSIADEVAEAMKNWAVSKGATHYTHWFQPLTGLTAEKHDSFIELDGEGGVIMEFSGDALIQGEPDASSFPSGGLRPTFEARGYTGWDPTSPAFIKEGPRGATLCIPTYFVGWHGEALDKKTPLLRSMKAVSKQIARLAKLLNIKIKQNAFSTMGGEQEYFLIDRNFYEQRIDLVQTGRTLFGKEPAKHQQMADHYFGAIKDRVIAFMEDLDREMWRLGAPLKTRHNEVAPGQYEVAPIYENQNLAVDHNMLTMEVMQKVAKRHDLVCLLHEKPFAGINGSGKHCNWSITGPDGKNWLSPGDNPHENERFLIMLCAVIKATDEHAGFLRASVASAGNDHRLGSHEAPPAIISIYLGDQLNDIIEQIEKGSGVKSSKKGGTLEVGVDSLPTLPRHASDRNRTSPFAFTGNRFEFRMVGSTQSTSGPMFVLNTIVAEVLSEIADKLEKARNVKTAAQKILQDIADKHRRIIFNGDNYTDEWVEDAEKRGLPNIRSTVSSLETIMDKENVALFKKHGVLTEAELHARTEILLEAYSMSINIEARTMLDIARRQILPASIEYSSSLGDAVCSVSTAGVDAGPQKELLKDVCGLISTLKKNISQLENATAKAGKVADTTKQARLYRDKVIPAMEALRVVADKLETMVAADLWPFPTYAEMLFLK